MKYADSQNFHSTILTTTRSKYVLLLQLVITCEQHTVQLWGKRVSSRWHKGALQLIDGMRNARG